MIWGHFKKSVPEMAKQAEESFGRNGLSLVGTIRSDGFPRISPVEVFFLPEELLLGMMKQSKKALDLERDARCVLHNTISDPNGTQPEFKLYGRAFERDGGMTEQYRRAYAERWKRNPPDAFPGHVFSIDIDSAAIVHYDTENNEMIVKLWDPELGPRETKRKYP